MDALMHLVAVMPVWVARHPALECLGVLAAGGWCCLIVVRIRRAWRAR